MTQSATEVAGVEGELDRLAQFVGRLYLLLITVVLDHPRWLPRDLRPRFEGALLEAYPAVQELQAILGDPGRDPRGADEVRRLLRDAGLSGLQLDLKLAAYRGGETRFYGSRLDHQTVPDRRFRGADDRIWLLPPVEEVRSLEQATEGGKHARSPNLLEAPLDAGDIVLGTLLAVFHVAEPYKEMKEGVGFAVMNWKLLRRARDRASWAWMKLRGG